MFTRLLAELLFKLIDKARSCTVGVSSHSDLTVVKPAPKGPLPVSIVATINFLLRKTFCKLCLACSFSSSPRSGRLWTFILICFVGTDNAPKSVFLQINPVLPSNLILKFRSKWGISLYVFSGWGETCTVCCWKGASHLFVVNIRMFLNLSFQNTSFLSNPCVYEGPLAEDEPYVWVSHPVLRQVYLQHTCGSSVLRACDFPRLKCCIRVMEHHFRNSIAWIWNRIKEKDHDDDTDHDDVDKQWCL